MTGNQGIAWRCMDSENRASQQVYKVGRWAATLSHRGNRLGWKYIIYEYDCSQCSSKRILTRLSIDLEKAKMR